METKLGGSKHLEKLERPSASRADSAKLVVGSEGNHLLPAKFATEQLKMSKIRKPNWEKIKGEVLWETEEKERKVGEIISSAVRVWGDAQAADVWLKSPHYELHGNSPLSLLATEQGRERVENLLGALEHGFPV